jgi:hypothetical protein
VTKSATSPPRIAVPARASSAPWRPGRLVMPWTARRLRRCSAVMCVPGLRPGSSQPQRPPLQDERRLGRAASAADRRRDSTAARARTCCTSRPGADSSSRRPRATCRSRGPRAGRRDRRPRTRARACPGRVVAEVTSPRSAASSATRASRSRSTPTRTYSRTPATPKTSEPAWPPAHSPACSSPPQPAPAPPWSSSASRRIRLAMHSRTRPRAPQRSVGWVDAPRSRVSRSEERSPSRLRHESSCIRSWGDLVNALDRIEPRDLRLGRSALIGPDPAW